jgi:hypothetical protein
MPHSATAYAKRAEECVRLANLTADEFLQAELLRLRQSYLRIAEKLGMPLVEAIAIRDKDRPD